MTINKLMKVIALLVLITLSLGLETAITDSEQEKGFLQLGVYICNQCNVDPGYAMECQLSAQERVCCEMNKCMKNLEGQWYSCLGENHGTCF